MHAVSRAVESELPFIYVNMVGGQDELVFDGGSFALAADGSLAAHLPTFSESTVTIRIGEDFGAASLAGQMTPPDEGIAALYRGLTLGLRDYVNKNGFPGVVLGLSGGIDSALVAALAGTAAEFAHGRGGARPAAARAAALAPRHSERKCKGSTTHLNVPPISMPCA